MQSDWMDEKEPDFAYLTLLMQTETCQNGNPGSTMSSAVQ